MYRLKNSTTYRHRGYDINRGSYSGLRGVSYGRLFDDLSRWYVDRADALTRDRRGAGFASLAEAVSHIDRAATRRRDAMKTRPNARIS